MTAAELEALVARYVRPGLPRPTVTPGVRVPPPPRALDVVATCSTCAPAIRAAVGEEPVELCASCKAAFETEDRCEAVAPVPHTQAGMRCERAPHGPEVRHLVAPRDGKPGAVWSGGPGSARVITTFYPTPREL